jgi:fucose 4-O-acetylase-like acetyltransferase
LQTLLIAVLLYMILDIYLNIKILSIVIIIFSVYTFVLAKHAITVLPFSLDKALCAMVFVHFGRMIKNLFIFNKLILSIGVISPVIYTISVYFLVTNYEVDGASFINSRIYSYNYFLFYMASTCAILLVLSISCWIKKIAVINYLGKHSLIILCIHFPFRKIECFHR